jgi:hypothetical protein
MPKLTDAFKSKHIQPRRAKQTEEDLIQQALRQSRTRIHGQEVGGNTVIFMTKADLEKFTNSKAETTSRGRCISAETGLIVTLTKYGSVEVTKGGRFTYGLNANDEVAHFGGVSGGTTTDYAIKGKHTKFAD